MEIKINTDIFGDITKYFKDGKPRVSEHQSIAFDQVKDREGYFKWERLAAQMMLGNNKKLFPAERLNLARNYVKQLKFTVPVDSDLFLKRIEKMLIKKFKAAF